MFVSICPECGRRFYRAEPVRNPEIMQHCPLCGADAFMKADPVQIPAEKKAAPFRIDGVQCYDLYQQKLRQAVFAPQALRSRFIPEPVAVYLPADEVRRDLPEEREKQKKASKRAGKSGKKYTRVGAAGLEEDVTALQMETMGKDAQPESEEADYLPMWVITGRYGNQVYQTRIDGQTGQVRANLPVSFVKYLSLCAVLTAILTVLLAFIPMPSPSIVLTIFSLAAITVLFLSLRASRRMAEHLGRRAAGEDPAVKGDRMSAEGREVRADGKKNAKQEDAVGHFLLRAGRNGLETAVVCFVLFGAEQALQPVIGYFYAVMGALICLIIFIFKRKGKPLLILLAAGVAYVFHAAADDGYETFAGLLILLFSILELRSFYHRLKITDQFPKEKKKYAWEPVPAAMAAIFSSFVLTFTHSTLLPADSAVHILTLAGILVTLIFMSAHYNMTVTNPAPEGRIPYPAGGEPPTGTGIGKQRTKNAPGSDMPETGTPGIDAEIGETFAAHFRDPGRGHRSEPHESYEGERTGRSAGKKLSGRLKRKQVNGIWIILIAFIIAEIIIVAVCSGRPDFLASVSAADPDREGLSAFSAVLRWIMRIAGAAGLSMLAAYIGLLFTANRRS